VIAQRSRLPGDRNNASRRATLTFIALALLSCTAAPVDPTPVSVPDLLREADALALVGRHTAAETRYRRAIELAPTDPQAALALADLYRRWERPAEALEALDLAEQRGVAPDELEAHRLRLLIDAGAWEEAEGRAQAILTHSPSSHEALVALLSAHLERGACIDAQAAALLAVERGVEDPAVVRVLALLEGDYARATVLAPDLSIDAAACGAACDRGVGLQLVRQGHWALAACLLGRATAGAPDDALAQAWYGESLARTGRAQAAHVHLRRSVELAPELPEAWLLLGALSLSTGDLVQARVALLNAQRLDPTNPAPCLAIAELKAQAGSYDEVDRWTEAALERAPDDAEIAKAVARFYLSRALVDSAVAQQAVELALRLAPDDAEVLTLLGWHQLARGQPEAALEALDRAVIADPLRAEAHYWQSRACLALGATTEADAALIRAADLGYRGR
jgi:tetratricopeptide (TPR) repeat protein